MDQASPDEMIHSTLTTAPGLVSHLREMIAQGYTDQQILELHPNLAELFKQT
jgi:cytochrome c-type biogenesis protein CcmH/NrfF